ncbi:MAG TPA: trypsin-like peptidase domain-containing protein [Jatrophihabitantaceae bacterium]|jgi:S1-C subfamily serine protease|nr:trypsin-like peptidase domain-containing protein [Jatrophihabitantaceae bacterium]
MDTPATPTPNTPDQPEWSAPEVYQPAYQWTPSYYPAQGYEPGRGYSPPGDQGYQFGPAYPYPSGYPYPSNYAATAPADPRRSRRRRRSALAAAGAVGALAIAGTVIAINGISPTVAGAGSESASAAGAQRSNDPFGGYFGGGTAGSGRQGGSGGGFGSSGGSGGGFGSGGGSGGSGATSAPAVSATAEQQVGVVDIDTVLKYQNAEAAGTGQILTANGEILTNNHVVDGATSISVTVVSTGRTYTANVVGTDPTADVAVIQLVNASGLSTVNLGDSSTVAANDPITGVGNAGGVGGTPSAATGTVVALNQSITASDESGGDSESLTGLIETNAGIQAGDSGGPLYNASGQVIGMDTAASTGSASQDATAIDAYAIPIDTALNVARQIEAGNASSTVHLGYPAFLGVSIDTSQSAASVGGAPVAAVIPGLAADQAGIAAGDVITSVGGHAIGSPGDLQAVMSGYRPGQTVSISWTDANGQAHHASLSLTTGPAD